MTRKTKINRAAQRKILLESVVPNVPGHLLEIIADIGTPEYLITRATEMLKEATILHDKDNWHERTRMAITLISLARVANGPTEIPQNK